MKLKYITIIILIFFFNINVTPVFSEDLKQEVKLKVVGDIMCHDAQFFSVYDRETNTYNFWPMFEHVEEHLASDFLIGNLETTFSGEERGYSSYPRFNTPDNLAATLKNLGFDFLFTANNHSLDKGEEGLKRTLDVLDDNQILHTGTFKNLKDSKNYCVKSVNGIIFGFLNYTYGTNGLKPPKGKEYIINYIDEEKIIKDIKKLRPFVDTLIVGIHFGTEYEQKPNKLQKRITKKMAEAGADIIIGGHPHVLQPYEFIDLGNKKCLVIYSMGNFISAQKGRYKDCGAILEINLKRMSPSMTPRITKVDYTPIWVRRFSENKRLKFTLVPIPIDKMYEPSLNGQEIREIKRVKNDTESVWKPFESKIKDNIFKINKNLPLTNPFKWVDI